MEVKEGYLYHIKDEFFSVVNDNSLMTNHERGMKRPTYFVIKDKEILWFIPLSSKVDKYKRIIANKIKRYGYCDTILIRKVLKKESVILLQNAFPTLEKYIDHVHTFGNTPAKVSEDLKHEIFIKFKKILRMKQKGINLFFCDIDKIENMLLKEIKHQK